MPWKDQSTVESRVSFMRAQSTGLLSMTELCGLYGISRTTGYKWLRRSLSGDSLADHSRAPLHSPHRTPADLAALIVAERLKHPHWGPDKIRAVLMRGQPQRSWPSATTMGSILDRHGLVRRRRRRGRRSSSVDWGLPASSAEPNEMWSTDFKGEFRMGNRRYCYPLTVADIHSRYVLSCTGLTGTVYAQARPVFERLFQSYGLPRAILSDNGGPFASRNGLARLTRLSVWWMRLGICPVTTQPGRPQHNGKHERMHRTLKAETTRPPGLDLADQQARFDRFSQSFNDERPHEALGQRPPSDFYRPSPRQMPAQLPEPAYPGHYEVARVQPNGMMKWVCGEWFISEALAGEWVGLEEVDDGVWSLCLDRFRIAQLDQHTRVLVSTRPASRCWAPLALRAPCAQQRDAGSTKCQPCPL